MPFFTVLIEGSDLRIPGEPGSSPIVGFFTSRVVWSHTKASAESKVLRSVEKLWAEGSYSAQPSASQLKLSVSESGPASLKQWLVAPRKGHTFFPEENASEA